MSRYSPLTFRRERAPPRPFDGATIDGARLTITLPPMSIVTLELDAPGVERPGS